MLSIWQMVGNIIIFMFQESVPIERIEALFLTDLNSIFCNRIFTNIFTIEGGLWIFVTFLDRVWHQNIINVHKNECPRVHVFKLSNSLENKWNIISMLLLKPCYFVYRLHGQAGFLLPAAGIVVILFSWNTVCFILVFRVLCIWPGKTTASVINCLGSDTGFLLSSGVFRRKELPFHKPWPSHL